MLKKMCSLLSVMIVLIMTLSGGEEKTKEPEEIVFLEESQITDKKTKDLKVNL